MSRLQLALELVEEAPVGAVGDDLLWARFDQTDLVQPQRVEAHGVLGVVLAPLVVGQFAQSLQRIVVPRGEAAIDNLPRDALRLGGAEIRRFEDGTNHALGRDRIVSDIIAVARQYAAKVLRPRAVERAVEDDAPDTLGAQLLRTRRKAEDGVDLALGEQLLWRNGVAGDPANVPAGVDTDVGGDDGQEQMLGRSQGSDTHGLTLEVSNPVKLALHEQFPASDMHAGDRRYRKPRSIAATCTAPMFVPKSIAPLTIASGVLVPCAGT